jgi:hypothetical protein
LPPSQLALPHADGGSEQSPASPPHEIDGASGKVTPDGGEIVVSNGTSTFAEPGKSSDVVESFAASLSVPAFFEQAAPTARAVRTTHMLDAACISWLRGFH